MKHFGSFVLALLLGLLLARFTVRAQSVGIGTTTPDARAALDIRATDKGLLVPRLSAAQRTGIAAPPQGLMVYQTDGTAGGGIGTGFWYFGGAPAAWVFINPAGGGADNLGNGIATTAVNLQGNALVGTGASIGGVGVGVRADGGLNLGQNGAGNNVFLGYQAGATTTGPGNLFIGYQAGQRNSTGIANQFSGYQSGYRNTTGGLNQFSGYQSGFGNTTGIYNYFSGYRSGYTNTTGSFNQFSGFASGSSNTTGSYNQFSGNNSGSANTTGNENTFSGYQSGANNTTGSANQFSGYFSGQANTTGGNNYFSGYQAGTANTTGDHNHFVGYQAGQANTTGSSNHFMGYQAGHKNTTGNLNQFEGYQAGQANTTGLYNLFVGDQAGYNNTIGNSNLAVGYLAGPTTGNLNNAGAIGTGALVSQSNSLVLGGQGIYAVNVGIGTSSPSQRLEVDGNGLFRGNLTATGSVRMGWTQISGTYNIPPRSGIEYILACPSGMRALGGGGGHRDYNPAALDITVNYSGPDPADPERKWRVILSNDASVSRIVRVYCNCARIAP